MSEVNRPKNILPIALDARVLSKALQICYLYEQQKKKKKCRIGTTRSVLKRKHSISAQINDKRINKWKWSGFISIPSE